MYTAYRIFSQPFQHFCILITQHPPSAAVALIIRQCPRKCGSKGPCWLWRSSGTALIHIHDHYSSFIVVIHHTNIHHHSYSPWWKKIIGSFILIHSGSFGMSNPHWLIFFSSVVWWGHPKYDWFATSLFSGWRSKHLSTNQKWFMDGLWMIYRWWRRYSRNNSYLWKKLTMWHGTIFVFTVCISCRKGPPS